MTYRWKLGVAQLVSLVCGLCLAMAVSAPEARAAKLEAFMVVKWEGRALEQPNLEALDAFRKKFPEIPVIHLINPSYFKESAKVAGDNVEAIQKRIADNDEVGLYLVPSAKLVKAADVLQLSKPTFWSYTEELCSTDCGLAVPMTTYPRADIVKLVYTAHSTMKEFGFTDLSTYAVHGFVHPAGVQNVAESLGYTNDLTSVDKGLVRSYLREYPIGQWVESAEAPAAPGGLKAWTQAGGLIEFNNDEEILKNFQAFFGGNHDAKSAFILSISQESLFMNSLRLQKTIQGLLDEAKKRGDELAFDVMSKGKKGRPIATGKGISKKS